ncbi:hypothetical protein BG846_00430 [Streptomyces fradiae ATCC 10745 = DSM 40063]|uniref:Uncharacterized protein n=1 Tax=Streptomyces fradiae ATCC 10745 = DSM 40063 TaxID=1319510 RepID=A0A1Y2P2C5_STRFR|nr:hypothetical protein BG846_00430 [Streptomyces fradiae ATCC 10745 = DSM 40063]
MPGVEAGVGAARLRELRVPQGAHEQVPVGDRPVHAGPLQRAGQQAQRLRAGRRVGDGLGEQRVVVDAHGVARRVPGVEAHARYVQRVQRAGLRGEGPRRVLRVQPGLHGVAARRGRLGRQGGALRDAQLEGHQVDAVHGLGDGVLDLEPGVHLQEVRGAVRADEELDGARAPVADGAGGAHGRAVQLLDQRLGQARRGGLLDDLLVAALEGAVAGAERPHRAVRVGQELHLHMASALQVRLGEDLAVAERRQGLGPRGGQLPRQRRHLPYDPHAPAAAPGRGLDQHGQVGLGQRVRVERFDAQQPFRAGLGRHRLDGPGRRAHPGQPGRLDLAREGGALGEEPVAGVHGVGAGREGRGDDEVAAQVGVGGGRARQPHGRVGLPHVQGARVRVGVHGDRADAEVAAGAEDAAGDLTAVGDEQGLDHGSLTSGRRRSRRGRPRPVRCGWPTGTSRGRCGCRAGR